MPIFRSLLAAVAVCCAQQSAAQPRQPSQELAQAVPALLALYAELGDFSLPTLDPADARALLAGEPVVTVFAEEGEHSSTKRLRVAGMQLIHRPRLLVWLSLLGSRERSSSRVSRALLAQGTGGAYVTYQHMDLPWPFKDRHWVILSEKNPTLAEDSGDRLWEHRWSLLPDGEKVASEAHANGRLAGAAPSSLDETVYLAANRGAWILFDLAPEVTLVAAYLDVDLGSQFPDGVVHSFTKAQLRSVFESLRVSRSGCDYREEPLVHDGRGVAISRHALLSAAPCAGQHLIAGAAASDDALR